MTIDDKIRAEKLRYDINREAAKISALSSGKIDGYERLAAVTNKDDHEDNYKKIFEELAKERFDEIKELTDETNQNDLIYYSKGNTLRKRLDNFSNIIELLSKIKPGKIKLEEAKNLQNKFLN